jgi:calcineurin-binding protein cabin-1
LRRYSTGTFRLATVGIDESARKYVAARRRATRLYLALCFTVGDLASLVAAPMYIGRGVQVDSIKTRLESA